jgi:hypothetical protein
VEEKKHVIAKLAPILIAAGLIVFVWSFTAGFMTTGLLINGVIAGMAGALVMSIAMMMVGVVMEMKVIPPKLVSANLDMGSMWMAVHFFTGISFALGYIIASRILGMPLSVLGAVVFALLGPAMFLGLIILPDNEMGLFGMSVDKMMPMMIMVMHIIYGAGVGATLVYLG